MPEPRDPLLKVLISDCVMLRSDDTVTTKRLVTRPATGEPAEATKRSQTHKGGGYGFRQDFSAEVGGR
jgi:hypothetical protein